MDLLQKGQKISINIQNEDKIVEMSGSISKVYDDRIDVELPPYFMRYVEFLEVGKPLTIKVFSKIGTIDFNTVVISSPLEDDNFTIEFDANALKLTVGEELPVIGAMEKLRIYNKEWSYMAKTFEISTENIKFYSDKVFNIDENLNCELILPSDYGTINFKITITERDEVYDKEYTASFYNMNENDRQTLLYYMYVYSNDYSQEEK